MKIPANIIKFLLFAFLALIAYYSLNDTYSTGEGVAVIENVDE